MTEDKLTKKEQNAVKSIHSLAKLAFAALIVFSAYHLYYFFYMPFISYLFTLIVNITAAYVYYLLLFAKSPGRVKIIIVSLFVLSLMNIFSIFSYFLQFSNYLDAVYSLYFICLMIVTALSIIIACLLLRKMNGKKNKPFVIRFIFILFTIMYSAQWFFNMNITPIINLAILVPYVITSFYLAASYILIIIKYKALTDNVFYQNFIVINPRILANKTKHDTKA